MKVFEAAVVVVVLEITSAARPRYKHRTVRIISEVHRHVLQPPASYSVVLGRIEIIVEIIYLGAGGPRAALEGAISVEFIIGAKIIVEIAHPDAEFEAVAGHRYERFRVDVSEVHFIRVRVTII